MVESSVSYTVNDGEASFEVVGRSGTAEHNDPADMSVLALTGGHGLPATARGVIMIARRGCCQADEFPVLVEAQ
jgi:hypothetical protein